MTFFVTSLLWELCEISAHALWFREDRLNYELKRALIVKSIIVFFHSGVLICFLVFSTQGQSLFFSSFFFFL